MATHWSSVGHILLTACALLCVSPVGAEQATPPATSAHLKILTWADYIDPEVVQEFERKFDARVEFTYFESDDGRDDILVESDGAGFDVVVVNSPQFPAYRKRGWLAPLKARDIPNIRYVEEKWLHALPEAVGFGVPYFWGTTGIAYRADLVPEPITSWRQLFQPSEALRGRIVLVKNARDVIGMALKSLGFSANSEDMDEIGQAEHILMAQKPLVRTFAYVSLGEESELVTGEAWVAMMYNGDAAMVREHNTSIVYVVPEEGGEIWIDYLTVLESSSNKKVAADFIDFVNQPGIAARVALFVHYATPNNAAETLLPTDFLQDPIIYPAGATLARSEFYRELAPRATKRRNALFARLLQ